MDYTGERRRETHIPAALCYNSQNLKFLRTERMRLRPFFVLILICAFLLFLPADAPAQNRAGGGAKKGVAWQDDFDTLDLNRWVVISDGLPGYIANNHMGL